MTCCSLSRSRVDVCPQYALSLPPSFEAASAGGDATGKKAGGPQLVMTRSQVHLLHAYTPDRIVLILIAPRAGKAAGAGVKTNLLFFTKGQSTERVWYYDLSDVKVGKKTRFTLDRFEEFFRPLPDRVDSDRSWSVSIEYIAAKNYDLKAVNPNAKSDEDTRTPEELLDLIEAKGREVAEAFKHYEQCEGRFEMEQADE